MKGEKDRIGTCNRGTKERQGKKRRHGQLRRLERETSSIVVYRLTVTWETGKEDGKCSMGGMGNGATG